MSDKSSNCPCSLEGEVAVEAGEVANCCSSKSDFKVSSRVFVAGNSLVVQDSSAVQVDDNCGNVSKMRERVSFLFFSNWRCSSEEVEKFGF